MIRWIKKKLQKIKAQNNIQISSSLIVKFEQQMIVADVSYEDHNEVSGERNSIEDQQSESEKGINGFESLIRSKDEEIRLLKHRLALKDEKIRHLKRQLHLREKESACLRIAIQSACTNLGTAVTTADDAFKFTDKNPPEKGMKYMFTEENLLGAEQTDP